MIQLFSRYDSAQHSRRASQEMKAARDAPNVGARAAHLDLAARHFTALRDGLDRPATTIECMMAPALKSAFPLEDVGDFRELIERL